MGAARSERPFTTLRPDARTPLLLSCEHATSRLPAPYRASVAERSVLASHWGWDPGAWALTRELSRRLRACAVGTRWTRLLVDPNRRADDPTLIRRCVEGHELSWNRALGAEEIERRLEVFYGPYHEELDRRIRGRLVRGIRPLIFAVHSYTPEFAGRRRDYPIGVLYDGDRAAAHRLGRLLRGAGLPVRYNQPYSGKRGLMYSAHRHGTHHGLPSLELEVNQGLFEGAGGIAGRARRLAEAIAPPLGKLIETLV